MSKKFFLRTEFLPLGFASVGLVVLIWYAVTVTGYIQPIFLPSLGATFRALWKLLVSGIFFRALIISFARIAIATILAVVAGAAVGVCMGVSHKMESFFSPIIEPLRYLPITALIPILVLWFGIGETMKIMFLFLGIVFYFIPLVRNAIRSTPQEYIDIAKSFGAKFGVLARDIYWLHALPQIFDGIIVVNGIGWTYVILAEIINAREGLGYLINIAGRLQRSNSYRQRERPRS